jgi:hypothetical protein
MDIFSAVNNKIDIFMNIDGELVLVTDDSGYVISVSVREENDHFVYTVKYIVPK